MKPEMKHCGGCGAPNPQHLKACYACGRILDQASPPPPQTYPCRACEQPVPFSAPVCPHCGLAVQADIPSYSAVPGMALDDLSRLTNALQQARAIGSIGDWEIEPLPDGTTRLTRGFWSRLTRVGASNTEEGAALMIFGLGALFFGLALPRRGEPFPYGTIFVVAFSLLFILLVIWMVGASEQLRVGKDLLERRRTLGKLQRVQHWEGQLGATFRVSQYKSVWREGYHIYRRLQVSGKRGWVILDSYEVSNLLASEGDDAGALGRFLAQITGWTLLGS